MGDGPELAPRPAPAPEATVTPVRPEAGVAGGPAVGTPFGNAATVRSAQPPPGELSLTAAPVAPKPAFRDWHFRDAAAYDSFAASHKATKWAQVLTRDGEHVAWGLTIEAVTRMADKIRAGQDDFEFLDWYPGGKVVGVHLYGRKLESMAALAELYFRTREAALDGAGDMLPECEVYQMEGGRSGRRSLGHSHALLRWKELTSPTVPAAKGGIRYLVIPRGSLVQLLAVPVGEIETLPGHRFQGLRVKGARGMQTIYPETFADLKRRLELEVDLAGFDPIADDVKKAPDYGRVGYQQIVAAYTRLIARKRDIANGREPPTDLDAINARLAELGQRLAEQGVRLDESQIIDKLDAARDLKEFDGRLLVDPPATPKEPYYLGQRLTARIALDYVPPGAAVKVRWTWKPADRPDNLELPKPEPGEEFQLTSATVEQVDLGVGFWNRLGVLPRVAEQAQKLKLVARVSLNDDETVVLIRESDWLDFSAGGTEPPKKLTVVGKTEIMAGEEARYQLAEWTPLRHRHYFLWTEDGERYPSRESADLAYISRSIGTHQLSARVYSATNDGTMPPVREAIPLEVKVVDPALAGAKLIAEMEKHKKPALGEIATSVETSIDEINKRIALGGGSEAYWKERLETQEKRLRKLNELAPDAKRAKQLPSDPTQLLATELYSGPISAVLAIPEAGAAQPLSVHVTARKEGATWRVRLIDSTSSDVWRFDGAADGDSPLAAYRSAFRAWKDNNPYPRGGRLVHSFKPPGWTEGDGFSTDRWDKTVKDWVDGIALVVGALLMLVPEPTGLTKLIGGLILVATTVKAGVTIYENIKMGMDPLDSRNVFEGISILTTFLGVSGTALRSVGISSVRPMIYRAGNYLVLSAIAVDAGTLVYATGAAIAELRAIAADPTRDDGEKATAILSVMQRLMAQGLIFFASNRDLFKGGLKKSDYFSTDADTLGARKLAPGETPHLETGSRLDIAVELRKAGEAPARLQPGVLPDKELIERFYQLPWLNETLGKAEVAQLLNRVSAPALTGLTDIPAARAKKLADGIGNDAILNELAPALKGSKLEEMAAAGGSKIADHHKNFGADGVVWAASDLSGREAMRLLDAITPATASQLRDVTGPQVKHLLDLLGKDTLNAAAAGANGRQLTIIVEMLGRDSARGVVGEKVRRKLVADLAAFADRLDAAKATTLKNARPMTAASVSVDTNTIIAIEELMTGVKWADLAKHRQNSINYLRGRNGLPPLDTDPPGLDLQSIVGTQDLRMANVLIGEKRTMPAGLAHGGLELPVSRDTTAYSGVLAKLSEEPPVGGAKGYVDRGAIADTMFAKREGGPPTFVTADVDVYTRMARFAVDKTKVKVPGGMNAGDYIAKENRQGFLVRIPDGDGVPRDLLVVPIGRK